LIQRGQMNVGVAGKSVCGAKQRRQKDSGAQK